MIQERQFKSFVRWMAGQMSQWDMRELTHVAVDNISILNEGSTERDADLAQILDRFVNLAADPRLKGVPGVLTDEEVEAEVGDEIYLDDSEPEELDLPITPAMIETLEGYGRTLHLIRADGWITSGWTNLLKPFGVTDVRQLTSKEKVTMLERHLRDLVQKRVGSGK